ncbi:hypothetical protein GCM10025771_00610 [Niveibacterium umoris]|uniref:Uncharacterized protein n=1 Tax=Niveibacterium umoris TaxID=1193620 RepID=A0A840BNT9_9RHOO|nr:hypothetical protein [Niveibacterium umoris]MBB4014985.1 hypothetical protein [Niveibacterium umoris]
MFELLFEIIGEFLLQAFFEALAEIGLQALVEPFRRRPNPYLASFGYAIFGTIAGTISLFVFPTHFVSASIWRIANLVFTPVATGLFMAYVGSLRARRGYPVLRIDRFSYAYLFALCMALVRFWFAK